MQRKAEIITLAQISLLGQIRAGRVRRVRRRRPCRMA
jgi:hypothetical protein